MPKIKFALLLVVMVTIASCTHKYREQKYFRRYHTLRPFVSSENIYSAKELRKKYPDESFADVNSEILVEFYLGEGEELSSDSLMRTQLKARVTYFHTILSLHDAVRFQYPIFYNEHMKVSPVRATYTPYDQGNWFNPNITDYSYEIDGYFYSDSRLKTFSASMPTLGTQLRFTYSIEYENVNYLANIFFPESFPVDKRKIIVRAPEWLDLSTLLKNTENTDVTPSAIRPEKSLIADFRRMFERGEGLDYNWYGNYSGRDFEKEGSYHYKIWNINGLAPRNSFVAEEGPSYYLPHILFRVNSYKNKEGNKVKVIEDVQGLYNWYRKLVLNIGNDPEVIREKAAELVKGKNGDEEKVKAIFYWVQDNVRYLAFEDGIAGFRPEPCQMVFTNRYGDCKGMANLLAEMLKSQGYDARLTWIGTRRIAYDYSEPSMAVDNHMICTLMLDGKRYFLDATEDLIGFGDYAHRIQGREVLIEDGDTYILDRVPDLNADRNAAVIKGSFHLENGAVVGEINEWYKGESHTRINRYLHGLKSEKKEYSVARYLNRAGMENQVTGIRMDSVFSRTGTTHFNYQFTGNDLSFANDTLVYLRLNMIQLPFYSLEWDENRPCGMSFSYKVHETHEYRVQIPKGWTVKDLPEPVVMENSSLQSELSYSIEGNELIMKARLILPEGGIPLKDKEVWEENRTKMENFYASYVVFVKK